MTQTWKPVVGFEGLYEVSDHGNVRSLDRVIRSSDGRTSKVKGRLRKIAYLDYARLCICKGGKRFDVYPHRLVMAAFVGPCPEGKEVAHNDGNSHNNRLSNLRYATPSENNADKFLHGTAPDWRGTNAPKAKLSEAEALAVMCLAGEYSHAEIGRAFGISGPMVHYIATGHSWGHLLQ